MSTIFLDIDGVLNTKESRGEWMDSSSSNEQFEECFERGLDETCIQRFNTWFLEGQNPDLILISGCRLFFDLDSIEQMLQSRGFKGGFADALPIEDESRSTLIENYRDQSRIDPPSLIIDDDPLTEVPNIPAIHPRNGLRANDLLRADFDIQNFTTSDFSDKFIKD